MGYWFYLSVGVRQGCLLSPTPFNILLECIMSDALQEHYGTVSTGGRTTTIRFADDIGGLVEKRTNTCQSVEPPGQNIFQIRHADLCRKDIADDRQHKAHRKEDRSQWAGARNCESVQVPWSYSQ